jgi:cytochrome c553
MKLLAFLLPFLLLGGAVLFIAFSGGPRKAREAYLTRGGRGFTLAIPVLYIVLGVVVPALILAGRGQAAGGNGSLQSVDLSKDEELGKDLFRQHCSSCHNLDAVNANGVTGPDLDEIGQVTTERIVGAIETGGTGQDRMPANLVAEEDAQLIGEYVSKVASR